ncbi:MAG: hypothetical protein AAFN11_14680, partial [Chloroflexota bacterium]
MNHTQRERILIVAKDDAVRHDIVETLEHAGGYATVEANTFEEALSEILLADFDLIITEAELPDLSGMDLLAVVGGLGIGWIAVLYPATLFFSEQQIETQLLAQSASYGAIVLLGICL